MTCYTYEQQHRGMLTLAFALAGACAVPAEPGAPARLLASAADTVVVNDRQGMQIPLRALDASGREVPATGVRYAWTAGDSIDVTADGTVTCTRRGDATVRASFQTITTSVVLRCRPVDRLAGTVSEQRGGVVAVERGLRLRALMAGATVTTVIVGDQQARVGVHVYEPARDLDGLRDRQELVAISLRLTSGETRRWSLPAGGWMLTMMPYEDEATGLRLRVEGAACRPLAITRRRIACAVKQRASVIVYHPSTTTAPDLTGRLLVRRVNF